MDDRRVWLGLALFIIAYFAAYVNRVCMGYIGDYLAIEIGFEDPDVLRSLASSAYLYAYAIAQFPLGVLIDSIGLILSTVIFLVIAAIGNAIVALSRNLTLILVGRALIGLGCALPFLASQKFIARYLPIRTSAIATSLVGFAGCFGGIYAQYLMVLMVEFFGVRISLLHIVVYLLVPAVFIPLVVRDKYGSRGTNNKLDVFRHLPLILKNKHMIGTLLSCAIAYSCILLLQTIILRDFMMESLKLSIADASGIATFFSLGFLLGQFTIGFISDRVVKARKLFAIEAHIALIISALYLLTKPSSMLEAIIVVTAMGIASAGQMVTVPMSREVWPQDIAATALAYVNMGTFVVAALLQNIVPYVFKGSDTRWDYTSVSTAIIILNVLGLLAVYFFAKETYRPDKKQA